MCVCSCCDGRPAIAYSLRPRRRFELILADDLWIVRASEAAGPYSEYLQTVKALSRLGRRYWFDVLIVVGIGVSIVGAILGQGRRDGPVGPAWVDVILVIAILAPLFFRRRYPFGGPIGVGVAVVIASFIDGPLPRYDFPAFLAGCAALFLLDHRRDRAQAVAGLALAVGVEAIVVHHDPLGTFGELIFVSLIFAVVWTIGFTLGRKFEEAAEARERALRAEREREERARSAVAEERARIARELHDVVGHSVSVMTVQASGVRRLLRPDQER